MALYIHGIGSIGPYLPVAQAAEAPSHAGTCRLTAIEPAYQQWIPPMQLRRMSRIIRMGLGSAIQALQDAGITQPDRIHLGTAYGCVQDTTLFLAKMLEQDEEMLTPTAFVQSTHNTIAGQIALHLKCTGENMTYVQRGHSFESALFELFHTLPDHETALTGGADELTNDTFDILQRFESLYPAQDEIARGEGAHLFVVSPKPKPESYAVCRDLYLGNASDADQQLNNFLQRNQLQVNDLDLVLMGCGEEIKYEQSLVQQWNVLHAVPQVAFKKNCGEYPSSGAFAMAWASAIIKNSCLVSNEFPDGLHCRRILICNHFKGEFISYILLEAC
ncbi:MAG TPA: beta-ketoacyl synthase chain length factor [Chitinophagaceae bacterium]|nr:beta-ketoacyl synthase chain length factor [Chitinophagaceae bacterium]HNF71862.1 beta-ketoacyl synthase chain length factor [Chitinophagaceae bacterium]